MTVFTPFGQIQAKATVTRSIRTLQRSATIQAAATISEIASTFPFLQFLLHRLPLTSSTGTIHYASASLSAGAGKFTE